MNETLKTLKERRSCRSYRPDPVPAEILDRILEAGTYAASGMGLGMDSWAKEGQTLILNAKHPLVKYVMEHEEDKNVKLICRQLYDLAQIQNAPLSADDMAGFIARSNEIMLMLTKESKEEKTESEE